MAVLLIESKKWCVIKLGRVIRFGAEGGGENKLSVVSSLVMSVEKIDRRGKFGGSSLEE